MRAAVIREAGVIEVRERDLPSPTAEQVLVEPLLVGLCGSDLSYFRKGANGAFVIREPLTIGHEITARVLAPVGTFTTGDRVIVHPVWPVPPEGALGIPAWLASEPGSFLGSASTWPHTQGGLAERVAVRPEQLRSIPDSLPTERATLAEPLSVVLHALDRVTEGVAGARVLVCGAGPIGLLTVIALLDRGATSVDVTDLHERPLAVARSVGATSGFRVGTDEVPASAYDLVVEATGVAASLELAIRGARVGGTVLQLGMLPAAGITVDLSGVVAKELRLVGTHRFLAELDAAIALLARSPQADAIVTDVIDLGDVAEALARAGDAAASSKVLVRVGA